MKRDHNKEAEKYRRKQMMQAFNKAYAALRADPAAWQELQEERAILEGRRAPKDPDSLSDPDGKV